MARIRSIKPEFPQSETIGKLSRDARLLFIQLWTIVDDAGRARAASRMLASLLYPYDDDAVKLIDKWLKELAENGCIRIYDADGKKYLDIPKWLKHQKIDKPSKSRLPEHSPNAREASPNAPRTLAPDLGSRTLDLGEDQVSMPVADATCLSGQATKEKKQSRKPSLKVPFPEGWKPKSLSPNELANFDRFHNSALAHGRVYVNWEAAWNYWKSNSYPEQRAQSNGSHPPQSDKSVTAAALRSIERSMAKRANGADILSLSARRLPEPGSVSGTSENEPEKLPDRDRGARN